MAKVGSKEWKENISKAKKGHDNHWLGKKHTEESKKKMGRKWSLERRDRIYKKRGTPSIETRIKLSDALRGSKSPMWRGGITTENRLIRSGIEYSLWRKAVFVRDRFTCQKYKHTKGHVCAHHINNFADFPELRFAIDNGITLSKKAHEEFHKKYGVKNNTMAQLLEFLNS